ADQGWLVRPARGVVDTREDAQAEPVAADAVLQMLAGRHVASDRFAVELVAAGPEWPGDGARVQDSERKESEHDSHDAAPESRKGLKVGPNGKARPTDTNVY